MSAVLFEVLSAQVLHPCRTPGSQATLEVSHIFLTLCWKICFPVESLHTCWGPAGASLWVKDTEPNLEVQVPECLPGGVPPAGAETHKRQLMPAPLLPMMQHYGRALIC